ncbi:MAG TPA: hypothetical protein VNO84_11660 [Burkholderiaceae bacterium]|nr:hypothetical protein [Burkholderiaceae bacterium]
MTSNQMLTFGAIAFAGFALWWINREPGAALPTQPRQLQQDLALRNWFDLLGWQEVETSQAVKDWMADMRRQGLLTL